MTRLWESVLTLLVKMMVEYWKQAMFLLGAVFAYLINLRLLHLLNSDSIEM